MASHPAVGIIFDMCGKKSWHSGRNDHKFQPPIIQPGLLQNIDIRCQESQETTTFANLYNERGERRQIIEVSLTQSLGAYSQSGLSIWLPMNIHLRSSAFFITRSSGICPQGMDASLGLERTGFRKDWENFKEVLPYADLVFFSEEDVIDPKE